MKRRHNRQLSKALFRITLSGLVAMATFIPSLSAKKVLGHDDFDSWKRVKNYSLSKDGRWAAYATVPQEGDAMLYFCNTSTKKRIEIARGYNPQFTADGRYAVALIKPFYAETRQAKIDKKKDFDMPQDSLAIVDLHTGNVEKIGHVKGFSLGKDGGNWVAYKSCDTLHIKPKALKEKGVGLPLIVRNLAGPQRKIVKWVDTYVFSKDGSKLAMTLKAPEKDTLATNGAGVIMLPDTAYYLIDRDKEFYGTPVFNETGSKLAYTASNDTIESGTLNCSLYLCDLGDNLIEPRQLDTEMWENEAPNLMPGHAATPEEQADLDRRRQHAIDEARGKRLFINQYSKPEFSHNGKRLVIGIAPAIAPDDTTIYDFERADLDIWRWDAPYTPPMENKMVDALREKTFPMVIELDDYSRRLLTNNPLASVYAPDRWDGQWALLSDPTEGIISKQWNYLYPEKLISVDVTSGSKKEIGIAPSESFEISPCGKYVVYFKGKSYYCYNNATGETVEVSKGVEYPLWDTDDDHPMAPQNYGTASWTAGDEALLVYDKYDIWSLDPTGKREPICLTKGEGRKTNRTFRYENLDAERRYLSRGDLMVLTVFDHIDKRRGLATMNYGAAATPEVRVIDKASFTQLRKAEKANDFTWQRASFEIAPNIWLATSVQFSKAQQLTDANPQQKEYNWGTAQLVKWHTYSGKEAEGVLYLPEDFDSSKSYPMLSVFYERAAEDLYTHYTMEPSWSWVNYPFYVSRGYVVFVPDIYYTAGVPGEGAYDYVCSGVEAMCEKYPNIDKNRLGIDGQSWGGYQTAYLVTRTNMFACAGSGAPVANMTSAFGGIRWGTGDSRQAQYEMGQSRIGRNLWDAPELYIANSPVFHANRVETPLLIMHNDADGAVPWYQGIEMFMALRRLGKPVWMLQYNGEAHNIRLRKNRKDITKRLQQFFDHYLMGDPMPKWMKEGIPAVRKGQEFGF
ncbi:MAG: prolyl oligopeptidase family serine peptidase [Clostridium sp.]|nr:prolyl oligopeptidase family serine peptidase [Prevotella sp.]MCM1429400.1 prolyl oligopeptidase family serine peptidase [Clostridium sp.]